MNLTTPKTGLTVLTDVSFTNTGTAPISQAQVKAWGKVETDADDAIVTALISEVIDEVERTYNFSIIEKTVTALFEKYGKTVPLPYAPVKSITSIHTVATDGEETELEATEWHRVGNKLFFSDPKVKTLKVVYVAGWATVPSGIVLGLRKAILSAFSDREDVAGMTVELMPNSSRKTFKRYANY